MSLEDYTKRGFKTRDFLINSCTCHFPECVYCDCCKCRSSAIKTNKKMPRLKFVNNSVRRYDRLNSWNMCSPRSQYQFKKKSIPTPSRWCVHSPLISVKWHFFFLIETRDRNQYEVQLNGQLNEYWATIVKDDFTRWRERYINIPAYHYFPLDGNKIVTDVRNFIELHIFMCSMREVSNRIACFSLSVGK